MEKVRLILINVLRTDLVTRFEMAMASLTSYGGASVLLVCPLAS